MAGHRNRFFIGILVVSASGVVGVSLGNWVNTTLAQEATAKAVPQPKAVGKAKNVERKRDDTKARSDAKADIQKLIDDEDLDVHVLSEAVRARSRITVVNESALTVYVKISKACGAGQDGFWEIPPGGRETWMRCVYHRVNMRASHTPSDDGIFHSIEHTTMVSTGCNSFKIEGESFVYQGPPECL